MNNEQHVWGHSVVDARKYTTYTHSAPRYSWYSYFATATATGSITDSTAQDYIPEKAHQQVN